eukprot:CAMPEP_0170592170 /NCGR_PEP_ID=MMETSP0224-20130122/12787_1 /TAXON_ID=285029 /ORGANISM="Togula jolla, Strain CCCM 725" /LENGTH=378 /DNA_ID=CAMNT_0010916069 /DNA_START=49 /DNA_END=1185 /DNA_ORIENTATION=-
MTSTKAERASPVLEALRAIESDALVDSSFRRLAAALEAEREKVRGTWLQIEQERDSTVAELEHLRKETEDWCFAEGQKQEAEWRRLDTLSEQMSKFWPEKSEILELNCSGRLFTLSKGTLCGVKGSYLSQLFSEDFESSIPRDSEGRYFLDFNAECFALIVEFLQNRRLRPDAPIPVVPSGLRSSMDHLAEALRLTPFLRENRISAQHNTSLSVERNTVSSRHMGWQVISAEQPLPVASSSYFEVTVVANPDPRGGLAVGLCGHIPQGAEVHSLCLNYSVMYNSNNGLTGDCIDCMNVDKGVRLVEGSKLGISHDVESHTLTWYFNGASIGTVSIRPDCLEHMKSLFPVFALYVPNQKLRVDFNAVMPSAEPRTDAIA